MDQAVLMGVPLYTASGHQGMGVAPKRLRGEGIIRATGDPMDLGDVSLPELTIDVLDGRTKNLEYFGKASRQIYGKTREIDAEKAIILGGECSIASGVIAGLSQQFGGRPGILWMDAHGDFNTPETTPSGYIGGMALAMACGRGPDVMPDVEGGRPLIAEERLVHVGSRALDPPEVSAFNESPAKLFTSQQVKKLGAADVADEAARHLDNRSDWIICHLDVDVVDPGTIPAVTYPAPDGLTISEVAMIVRTLHRTGKVKVFQVTAYNASNDPRGESAHAVVDMVRQSLS